MPQSSALGLHLFHIYLKDFSYHAESANLSNFADDTMFYAYDKDLKSVINRLEQDS